MRRRVIRATGPSPAALQPCSKQPLQIQPCGPAALQRSSRTVLQFCCNANRQPNNPVLAQVAIRTLYRIIPSSSQVPLAFRASYGNPRHNDQCASGDTRQLQGTPESRLVAHDCGAEMLQNRIKKRTLHGIRITLKQCLPKI